MCLKNQFIEETFKDLRVFEKGEIKKEEDLVFLLSKIKTIQEYLEEQETVIKNILIQNYSGKIYYFPEIEKKVYLSEGRKNATYNIEAIASNIPFDDFINIVNIVKSKVEALDKKEIKEIVEKYTTKTEKNQYITVTKMNKKELIEQKTKSL